MFGLSGGIVDTLFWVMLIASALFSVLGFWKLYQELKISRRFRKSTSNHIDEVLDLLKAPGSDAGDVDYGEAIADLKEQLGEQVTALNNNLEVIQEMPERMRKKLDGATARQTQMLTKAEEEYMAGLDSLADKHLIGRLPPVFQDIAAAVAQEMNPQTMAVARKWLAKRPEVAQHLMSQPEINLQTQPAAPVSELDQYITR